MSVLHRLDAFQRRHPAFGVPLAVLYKFLDDQGAYLGALIAFYAAFSIFPMFLLLASVLGFVLQSQPALQDAIIDSAVQQVPVLGPQIQRRALTGDVSAVAIGVAGATYGSIAVATAIQNAMNVAWNVRRSQRPNPVVLRLKSVVLLCCLGLFVLATTVLSQVGGALESTTNRLSGGTQAFALAGSLVLSGLLFALVARIGTALDLRWRQVWPGAILAAVLWQALQAGGGLFIRGYVGRVGATEGVFALVLGLMAWLYIASMALVLCVELDVVLDRRLYPRALLTPMSDRVELTPADRLAYTHLVETQSLKGFQNVDVSFDRDGRHGTARRRPRTPSRSRGSTSTR